MQVLFSGSDESPGVDGLGVFDERIVALPDTVKRPQMQWNMIDRTVVDHPMFEGLADDEGTPCSKAWRVEATSFAQRKTFEMGHSPISFVTRATVVLKSDIGD